MIKSKDSVIVPALLTAFLEKEKKDTLNLMIPFILYLLPNEKGNKINYEEVEVEKIFNFGNP